MSHLNFWILAFSPIFSPIKSDLSGNTVWPQAWGFQKLAKLTFFGLLSTQNINVARFARNVEWDFFCDFQNIKWNFLEWFSNRVVKNRDFYFVIIKLAREKSIGLSLHVTVCDMRSAARNFQTLNNIWDKLYKGWGISVTSCLFMQNYFQFPAFQYSLWSLGSWWLGLVHWWL